VDNLNQIRQTAENLSKMFQIFVEQTKHYDPKELRGQGIDIKIPLRLTIDPHFGGRSLNKSVGPDYRNYYIHLEQQVKLIQFVFDYYDLPTYHLTIWRKLIVQLQAEQISVLLESKWHYSGQLRQQLSIALADNAILGITEDLVTAVQETFDKLDNPWHKKPIGIRDQKRVIELLNAVMNSYIAR
jgi:hypothetical protein